MKKFMIILTVLAFAFAGTALAAPKHGGTLVFGRGGDSVGLDPAYETDGNSFLVCDNIFEAISRCSSTSSITRIVSPLPL